MPWSKCPRLAGEGSIASGDRLFFSFYVSFFFFYVLYSFFCFSLFCDFRFLVGCLFGNFFRILMVGF